MAIRAISGKSGFVTLQTSTDPTPITYCLSSWEVSVDTDAVDSTNFCNKGLADNVAGLTGGECTLTGPLVTTGTGGSTILDVNYNPTKLLGKIVAVILGNTAGTTASDNFYYGYYLINSLAYNNSVDGKAEWTVTGTASLVDAQ
jgi:hypothetical protein